jgi:general bacterial porin, GBP family
MSKQIGLGMAIAIASATCSAQSSVTLYGELDEGISYINNAGGASVVKMRSGAWDGSRWGFKGSEDLGGGYKTIFILENGFDITSGKLGQNGREFGRTSYVGIATPFGTVTFGRQYDPIVDNLGPVMANGRASSPMFDLDNTGNDYETSNSVKFKSNTYAGFSFSSLYSFGGVAGQFSTNSVFGAGANYSKGPLSVGAAYTSVRNPYQTWYDGTGASSIVTYGAYLPNARDLNISAVGASYQVGQFVARAGMTHSVLTDSINGSNAQFNTYVIGGDYWVRPDIRFVATADLTDAAIGTTGQHPKYRQYNLVTDYLLSKRTDLYAWLIYGTAANGASQAQIGLLTASTTNRQVNVQLGIRHRF